MDPVTIGVGAGVFLLSLAWGWVKRRKPKLAAKLDVYEGKLKSAAGDAFKAVELLGAATGWDGARKLEEYKKRVESFTKRHGIPTALGDIDAKLEQWARDWSIEAVDDAELDRVRALLSSKYTSETRYKLGSRAR